MGRPDLPDLRAKPGVSQAAWFDTTEQSHWVSVGGDPPTRVTFEPPGTTEVAFSAQIFHAQRAQGAIIEMWFQHGTAGSSDSIPIGFSNSRALLPPDRDAYDVMTVSLLITTASLATVPATGGRPAIPAVVTVLPVA